MTMNKHEVSAVFANEKFNKLLRIRRAARYSLSFLLLVCHAFFVGGIAFYSQWFAQPLYAGSSIPLGIFFTVCVIIFMLVLEGVYIVLSNYIFDPLQREVCAEVLGNE
jgi:uncharacterized membrane protein (DUF485 family)